MIPIAKPWLGEEEVTAVAAPLRSGWVTQGPEVAAFEQEFAAFVGAPHACAVSNCTTGLHLALRALGVGAGDEVITVSHSFIATANAVRYEGSKPVFVDIEPGTFNIDVTKIKAAITDKTRAILCVHQLGMPADLSALVALAKEAGLFLIEDAACAIGSQFRGPNGWEYIGKPHGDVAVFSFHPRKLLTTGDGGMLTTRDPELDRRFRLMRQHGMSVSDTTRHSSTKVLKTSYVELGFNYRLTDIQASIGRVQLGRIPAMVARRRAQAERYCELLSKIPGIGLPHEPEWARTNWQSFCVRLPEGADQAAVMGAMRDAGVSTRTAVMCAHREPAYPADVWHTVGGLTESERAQDQAICIPLFHQLTEAEQDEVVAALAHAIK